MPGDGFGQIAAYRDGAEQFECSGLHLARQHADAHAFEIARRVNGPQPIGDVAEAVLEPAEDTVVDALFYLGGEEAPKATVDGRARGIAAIEQERQIDETEFGDAVGKITRRLIAEREHAILDEPQNFLGPIAEIHNVPDVFYADAVAEFLRQLVADELQSARERGRRRPIAAHAYGDRIGHWFPLGADATR